MLWFLRRDLWNLWLTFTHCWSIKLNNLCIITIILRIFLMLILTCMQTCLLVFSLLLLILSILWLNQFFVKFDIDFWCFRLRIFLFIVIFLHYSFKVLRNWWAFSLSLLLWEDNFDRFAFLCYFWCITSLILNESTFWKSLTFYLNRVDWGICWTA